MTNFVACIGFAPITTMANGHVAIDCSSRSAQRLRRVYGTTNPMDLPLGTKGTAIYAELESKYGTNGL